MQPPMHGIEQCDAATEQDTKHGLDSVRTETEHVFCVTDERCVTEPAS